MQDYSQFRCGYVAIVGKPNVGKSTILNRFIGEKLSIITPKPQTTRHTIKGILSDETRQLIFLDTPGFLEARYELHNRMLSHIKQSMEDADVILFITDASHYPTSYDVEVLTAMKKYKVPRVGILNKIDLCSEEQLQAQIDSLAQYVDKVIPVSAIRGDNMELILPFITKLMPYNPPYYDPQDLSDLPQRFFAQEQIREKIFLLCSEEIPYSSAVLIDRYSELTNVTDIYATIWVERDSQKSIVIGKGGAMLKKIREASESELSILFNRRCLIHLWVKVKKDWRKKGGPLKELGF